MAVLHDGVVEVAVERRLDSCHVLQLRDVAHGDLLLAVAGARRGSHGCSCRARGVRLSKAGRREIRSVDCLQGRKTGALLFLWEVIWFRVLHPARRSIIMRMRNKRAY